VISAVGQAKGLLGAGEHKSMPTDWVTCTKGADEEVDAIHGIFSMYLAKGMFDTSIARRLNSEGIVNEFGRAWSPYDVSRS